MKKILITFLYVAFTLSSNAQEKYKTTQLGNIAVVVKKGKSQGTVYLDLQKDGKLGLSLEKDQISTFVNFLKDANTKFKEWDKVAKDNNVQELKKDYKDAKFTGFFKYAKWKFGIATLSAKYSITGGDARGYIYVGSFESSSNQFIKSKSKVFFVTDELVKEMEDYLSKESLDAFINKSTSSDDLFN
jgi:hypothetical protein